MFKEALGIKMIEFDPLMDILDLGEKANDMIMLQHCAVQAEHIIGEESVTLSEKVALSKIAACQLSERSKDLCNNKWVRAEGHLSLLVLDENEKVISSKPGFGIAEGVSRGFFVDVIDDSDKDQFSVEIGHLIYTKHVPEGAEFIFAHSDSSTVELSKNEEERQLHELRKSFDKDDPVIGAIEQLVKSSNGAVNLKLLSAILDRVIKDKEIPDHVTTQYLEIASRMLGLSCSSVAVEADHVMLKDPKKELMVPATINPRPFWGHSFGFVVGRDHAFDPLGRKVDRLGNTLCLATEVTDSSGPRIALIAAKFIEYSRIL